MPKQFSGTGTALVTPFNEDGSVDYDSLQRVIDYNIEGGVSSLVSLGTTGETPTLYKQERLDVLEFTIGAVADRVPVIAGFGGSNTADIINDIKQFHFKGVSAILSSSPNYNKPTQEGIYQHYKAIAEAAPLPIIVYNVPGRTAQNITADTTLRLAELDNIIGIKEASGDMAQVMKIVQHCPENFLVVSGDDLLTLPMLGFGIDGVISVISNGYPHEFSKMVQHGLNGNFDDAAKLHFKLLDMIHLIFAEGNPAGIKSVLSEMGICKPNVRMPLVPASPKLQHAIRDEMTKIR